MSRMLTPCKEDFHQLAKNAGAVEKDCKRSELSENRFIKALTGFLRITLVALRAARRLKSEYPDDEFVKTYLHKLVDDVFDRVIAELDQEGSKDNED